MVKHFVFFCCFIYCQLLGAQNLSSFTYLKDVFEGERYYFVSASLVNLSNSKALGNPANHKQSVPFFDIYFLKPNFKKAGLNRRVDYKLITDIFWLFKTITEKDESKLNAEVSSTLSGGLLGWHMYHWNIVAKPRQCLSLGLSVNDYFMGAIYSDSLGQISLQEPQGWQIGLGPAVGFTQELNAQFMLLVSSAYVFNVLRPVSVTYAIENNSYPKPQVFHANLTLMSKWGAFAEAQVIQLINRGNIPNATRRLDLKLGFAFVL